ncbi:ParB/RepB/Spo0J family partition protein [Kitasatospora sp. NPDC050543]|uniref:ParB/RepB/Spo0J family partition protein n=1 Tax=Kitasatospora sp. NPDC050543 TaxID=3364054 RepID=UPI00379D727B
MSVRRGLGRGIGALIPPATQGAAEPASAAEAGGTSTSGPVLPSGRATVAARAAAESTLEQLLREQGAERAAEQPAALSPVDGATFAELALGSIEPNPCQPREVFDEEKLAELVDSIREVGLLQPVVVRRTGTDRYELIMGERRLRASKEAGLEKIPAIIRATEDDRLLLDALLENLHRAELNPLEEANAYDQLLRDFSCTQEELADRIGRSRPHITNTLRLLRLSPTVQRNVAGGVLSAGHARALLGLSDNEQQDKLALRILREGLSVRSTEEIVKLMTSEEKPQRPASPKAGKLLSPAFNDLAERLSDRFETRVKVEVSQRGGKLGKGKVVLEFGSVEDLNRILDSLAPGDDGLRLSQS